MLKVGVVLAVLLSGAAAQAATVTCNGGLMGYNVNMRAKMSGARFTSQAAVTITNGSEVVKQTTIRISRSQFIANRVLNFSGSGKDGSFNVATNFNGQNYSGNVAASGHGMDINFAAVCTVR